MALAFLTVKTFAPDVSTNAETISADAGSSLYSASISTTDLTSINITPSTEQTINAGTNSITYTNACPYGFFVSMSANSDNTGLERQGDDSGTKIIPTITSGNALADNTWGYSLNNGETYNPIPAISSPVNIINTDTSNTDPSTLNVTYGVKVNNEIPAGNYSKDIVYTVAVKPQCIVYDLKWNLNGGTGADGASYDDSEINYGRTLNLQDYKPTRNGYDFAGWKSSVTGDTFAADAESTNVNPTNAVEVTLTAQWTPINYPISYTLNGGSATNPANYNIETNTITLNNPTRTGYTFAGWTGSNGSTAQTAVTIPKGSTGDKNYTANWTLVNYTISYTMNGGSCSSPKTSYNVETATFALCTPTRNGYNFAGWTGSNGSTKQTSVSIPKGTTGNKSYTANWTAVNYTISYTLNGGSVSGNPTSYNIETATFALKNPTRYGYNFTGWTGSNGSTAQTSVSIAKGSTGNKSYTANWQATILAISNMQAMTSSICSATAIGTSTTLTDTRDNNTYTVKKLKDGKCWMTQNLRLVNKTISSADSNLPSGTTWTVPASSPGFGGGFNLNKAYLHSTYGGYYSFYAATAGWGTDSVTSGNSPKDICPKGWRLPTGGLSGEFQALYNKYNSVDLMKGEPAFTLSGNGTRVDATNPVSGTPVDYNENPITQENAMGLWWSSSVYNTYYGYNHYIYDYSSKRVDPADYKYKDNGYPVRCIAK